MEKALKSQDKVFDIFLNLYGKSDNRTLGAYTEMRFLRKKYMIHKGDKDVLKAGVVDIK